jgi:nicotinamide mononucleotide transporter
MYTTITTWTKFEKFWLVSFLLMVVGSTIWFSIGGTDYTSWHSILLNWVISPLSAISGIICVILVAKGKLSNYAWGVVNCVTYGYVAYMSGYYGDMLINLVYMLPFQLIGFLWWKNHLRPASKTDVKMRKLTWKQSLVVTVVGIGATLAVGLGLFQVDNWFVNVMKRNVSIYTYIDNVFHLKFLGSVFDASTEILQFIATILMTLAYAEQWILWIVTNVISILMWVSVIIAEPTSLPWAVPTLVMWCAYLVNSFYGYAMWLKGAKS